MNIILSISKSAVFKEEAAHGEDSRNYVHQETKPTLSTAEKIFVVAGTLWTLIAGVLFFAHKIRQK